MNITCGLVILVAGWSLQPTRLASVPGRDIEVLDHYAGTWDSQFVIQPNSDSGQPKSFTGVVTARRVVGGQFMEQTGTYRLNDDAAPLVIKTIMSQDSGRNGYRYDYFVSSGEIRRSTGQWDAAAKIMTSTFEDDEDGKRTTIVADFSKPGVEQWTIETRDRDGHTVLRVEGTNTRRDDGR